VGKTARRSASGLLSFEVAVVRALTALSTSHRSIGDLTPRGRGRRAFPRLLHRGRRPSFSSATDPILRARSHVVAHESVVAEASIR